MFDDSTICPYAGLRSFSEEESIFFKGRDHQIDEASNLLEKNKFLMVTGASGEGKSSLIFAGMIPNARAGFFKARYNNWQVIDFRPERTPIDNFARALSSKMENTNYDTVTTELTRGYSSLIDLYKNSAWYFNQDDSIWQAKTDDEKEVSKRESSNLLIIVDQFEEFFTNPENYLNSTPSDDAQVTLNILLETAKIALKEDLPIYVVCTMRSDYIGQCSAFRGLPEAIGFSQFFVPRLKRNELKNIIEEPALLNGNKISQRLVERLLYDLSEGIDQLPILQHALSNIWHAANQGKEELDLIHYAIIGGMPSSELPEEDKPRFLNWFKSLPDYSRKLYHSPGIKRVIEIHANQLYEEAYNYYKKLHPSSSITVKEVKNIIALTFACLTKIDDSRAVRNRMTLAEITGIVNKPQINYKTVNDILSIYREQNNSFIRPFISEEESSQKLNADVVLDITHESLIRNWGQLNDWAKREYDFYVDFLDFRKQLNRWLDSNQSKGYLLPIGPLTYFENWERECKPNKFWIYRYEENNGIWPDTLDEAQELLDHAHVFLKKSNRKALITRSFMKYGANRIAGTIALIAVLFLSSFFFIDAKEKRNENIIVKVIDKGTKLLDSKDIQLIDKSKYLLTLERRNPGSIIHYLENEVDQQKRALLALDIYHKLLFYNKYETGNLKESILKILEENVDQIMANSASNLILQRLNMFTAILGYDYYFNHEEERLTLLKKSNRKAFEIIMSGLRANSLATNEISQTIQYFLTFNGSDIRSIEKLRDHLSPFENEIGKENFNNIYSASGKSQNFFYLQMPNNGGYHVLASIFSVLGNESLIERSIDSLAVTKGYFNEFTFNSPANLIGYLYQNNHRDLIPQIRKKMSDAGSVSELNLMKDLLDKSGNMKLFYAINMEEEYFGSPNMEYINPNLFFMDWGTLHEVYADTRKTINEKRDPNLRNYEKAINYKQEGIFMHKAYTDKKLTIPVDEINKKFNLTFNHFDMVEKDFLEETTEYEFAYNIGGKQKKTESRRSAILYPDHYGLYHGGLYHSNVFFNYMSRNELFKKYYTNSGDLNLILDWVRNGFEKYNDFDIQIYRNNLPLGITELEGAKRIITEHAAGSNIDISLINLIISNQYFLKGNKEMAMAAYQALDVSSIHDKEVEHGFLNRTLLLNEIKDLSLNLIKSGLINDANNLISGYSHTEHKILVYLMVAEQLNKDDYDPLTYDYLDSVYNLTEKLLNTRIARRLEYRDNMLRVLSQIGGASMDHLSNEVLKTVYERNKPEMFEVIVTGFAEGGDYYKATQAIRSEMTDAAELRSYTRILQIDLNRAGNNDFLPAMNEEMNHQMYYRFNTRGL